MARKTHYEVLEVSPKASPEVITAAYERLCAIHDPARQENPADARVRLRMAALQDAYATLNDPQKRAIYDATLQALSNRMAPATPFPAAVQAATARAAAPPFWTWPKFLITGLLLLGISGLYFNHMEKRARLETEARVAEARAREAQEIQAKVRAETEAQRLAAQREREQERQRQLEEQRRVQERQAALQQLQSDHQRLAALDRSRSEQERMQQQRDQAAQRNAELRRRQEEQQAAMAARQQLARERAELCRIERERYGRVISC